MGDVMASKSTKPRPAGVPEENIYKRTHWTLFVAFAVVLVTGYFVIRAS